MKRTVLSIGFIALLMSTAPVTAQNINAVEARLDRMEREMQTLSRSVFKGDVPPPQITTSGGVSASDNAAVEMRINQMEETIRRLTGQIEEQGYQLRQMQQKLDQTSSVQTSTPSSGTKTVTLDDNAEVDSSVSSATTGKYQLGTLNSDGVSPAALYDKAFSYLQTNDYANAQATFEDFIAKYPDHSLAANSQYWLGETFYAREQYDAAARAFATSFQKYPDGQKAPDTLLKLAMSLGQQDMKNEACLTLAELKKRFPNGPVSVMKKADEEKQSYGCGA